MSELYKMRSFGFVEIEQEIWFANIYCNALMKLSKATGRIQVIDQFPNYAAWNKRLYTTICCIGESLVFVPCLSDEILSYNIQTKKFTSTKLDKKRIGEGRFSFVNGYAYGKYVYMFPADANCMIRYDVVEQTVKYFDDCFKQVADLLPENSGWFWCQFEVFNEKIYIPFAHINAIAIFDLKDESMTIQYLPIKGGCMAVSFHSGCLFLSSTIDPALYCWNIESEEIIIYDQFPKNFQGKEYSFSFAKCIGDRLFFFPGKSNSIIFFDAKEGILYEEMMASNTDAGETNTFCIGTAEHHNCILMENMDVIHMYDVVDGTLKIEPYCQLDYEYNKKHISEFLWEQGYYNSVMESSGLLNQYVESIVNFDTAARDGNSIEHGKRIFLQLKA